MKKDINYHTKRDKYILDNQDALISAYEGIIGDPFYELINDYLSLSYDYNELEKENRKFKYRNKVAFIIVIVLAGIIGFLLAI